MGNQFTFFISLIYFLSGFYFINYFFQFVKIPSFPQSINQWIFVVSGILLIIGGINFFRLAKRALPNLRY